MGNGELDQRELLDPCAESAFSDIASSIVVSAKAVIVLVSRRMSPILPERGGVRCTDALVLSGPRPSISAPAVRRVNGILFARRQPRMRYLSRSFASLIQFGARPLPEPVASVFGPQYMEAATPPCLDEQPPRPSPKMSRSENPYSVTVALMSAGASPNSAALAAAVCSSSTAICAFSSLNVAKIRSPT
ncbi:hypothetical protein QFZ98_000495 [Paraburkholderia youngii]